MYCEYNMNALFKNLSLLTRYVYLSRYWCLEVLVQFLALAIILSCYALVFSSVKGEFGNHIVAWFH